MSNLISMLEKYQKQFFLLFAGLVSGYFLFAAIVFLKRPINGDEVNFASDLNYIFDHGFISAIEHRISVPYMLVAYPFTFIFSNLTSLRLVNVLLMAMLILYFYYGVKIRKTAFYFYLLFYIATVNFYFSGINDPLFIYTISIFFTEVFLYLENGKMNSIPLAFSTLIVAFFTRELFFIYVPAVLISLLMLYYKGFRWFNSGLLIPMAVFLFFMVVNIPSFLANRMISYDNKIPPENVHANWTQRQYLAQLMVNNGEIPNNSHPSWEQTDEYLLENGNDSLPATMLSAITFNLQLTVTEFFKDFYYSIIGGFRSLGLILIFPICFAIDSLFRYRKISFIIFLPIILLSVVCILSFIIISYVELRWCGGVFIPAIVFYTFYCERSRFRKLLLASNYILLSLMSIYGLARIITRL